LYALKQLAYTSKTSERETENALSEIRYLASIDHPNIIGFKAAFLDDEQLCLVMEYASQGDLA
jgi:NIMA (never in mitosis gene a)-related kinase 1/4/5